LEILFLNALVFPKGKYLARNAFEHASHVVSVARLSIGGRTFHGKCTADFQELLQVVVGALRC
ncbi:hypothetical protein U9M48_003312, partial [Paspalum notatum var. saurae]